MKKILLSLCTIILMSCGGRTEEEQKAYEDSLFHVLSCSPTLFKGEYTLEDQLNACDLLIKERPSEKEKLLQLRQKLEEQIANESAEEEDLLQDLY